MERQSCLIILILISPEEEAKKTPYPVSRGHALKFCKVHGALVIIYQLTSWRSDLQQQEQQQEHQHKLNIVKQLAFFPLQRAHSLATSWSHDISQ